MAPTPEERRLLAQLAVQRAQLDQIADVTDRHLSETWVTAWDQIADDFDQLVRSITDPSVTKTIRMRRAQQALDMVGAKIFDVAKHANMEISADTARMITLAQTHTAATIGVQMAGVAASLARTDPVQLDAIGRRTRQQITARTFMLQADAIRAMKAELVRGVAMGDHPNRQASRMVAAVHGAFNGGLTRARTIARTETIDAYRNSAKAAELANADVLAGWMWLADLGPTTCRSCVGQHGSMHKLSEDGPDDHPNGRCTRLPVTKTWSVLGRKGIKSPDRQFSTESGPGWLKQQPTAVQRTILGAEGRDAWKAGKFPPSAWSVKQENPGWRVSYGAGKPPAG